MIELQPGEFSTAAPLFEQAHYGVLAAGTLEGGHPGRVFVDDPNTPSVGLVCTRVGYYFLAGSPNADTASLTRLFLKDLAPAQLALTGDPQILLFYDSPDWLPLLSAAFAAQKPAQIHKKRMVLSPDARAALPQQPLEPPAGFQLVPATHERLSAQPDRLNEILLFWDSIENFTHRGLGMWAMDGETLACSCESVFTGAGEVEIAIGTVMGYRRKGLARLTATAFFQACLARGLDPIWGCWPNNQPSVALARSLGFVDDRDQPVCFFEAV